MSGSTNTDVLLAGAAAAFTVDLLVYPLDTLKTRWQSQDFTKAFSGSESPSSVVATAAAGKPQPKFQPQLFRGLYQGVGSVILATLPAAGLFFSTYESGKHFLSDAFPRLPEPVNHSAASAVAEMASCTVLTPAEVIKQNAQMLRSSSSGTNGHRSTSLEAFRQLGGTGAGRKLLSGYVALVARNLPFTALQFPIFEYTRSRVWARRSSRVASEHGGGFDKTEKRSLLETGIVTGGSAGFAGSLAAFITTPSDVVKTRMMLAAGEQGTTGAAEALEARREARRKGKGAIAVGRQVYNERGVAGLFRGAALRAVWTAVGSGLYLGVYEVSKVWLTGDTDGNEQEL